MLGRVLMTDQMSLSRNLKEREKTAFKSISRYRRGIRREIERPNCGDTDLSKCPSNVSALHKLNNC